MVTVVAGGDGGREEGQALAVQAGRLSLTRGPEVVLLLLLLRHGGLSAQLPRLGSWDGQTGWE